LDLIKKGYIQNDDIQSFFYDDLFDELCRQYSYQDLIKISHYIIEKVIDRNFKDENNNIIDNKFRYFKSSMFNNIDKLESLEEIDWDDDVGWYKDNDEIELDI